MIEELALPPDLLKFAPIVKVDSVKREITCKFTSTTPDKDNERCHVESTIPLYKEWSAEFEKATDGKSLGNVRLMHQPVAIGKVVHIEYDPATPPQFIRGVIKVVDDDAWKLVEEGVLTGVSQGGRYVKVWRDENGDRWYTAKPAEQSLVDNPCNSDAHFEYVKADGSTEMRKFASPDSEIVLTWRLQKAIKETGASVVVLQAGLSLDGVKKVVEELEDRLAKRHDLPLCAEHGIDANEKSDTGDLNKGEKQMEGKCTCGGKCAEVCKDGGKCCGKCCEKCKAQPEKAAGGDLKKGMPTVANLAWLLTSIAGMQRDCAQESAVEGDKSPLPENLKAWLKDGITILTAMVAEEGQELIDGTEAPTPLLFSMAAGAAIGKGLVEVEISKLDAGELAKRSPSGQKMAAFQKCMDDANDHMANARRCCKEAKGHADEMLGPEPGAGQTETKATDAEIQKAVSDALNGKDVELQKITAERDSLTGELTKITTERDTLTGTVQTLTGEVETLKAASTAADEALGLAKTTIEQLSDRVLPPKGISKTVAISKDADAAHSSSPEDKDGKPAFKVSGDASVLQKCLATPSSIG